MNITMTTLAHCSSILSKVKSDQATSSTNWYPNRGQNLMERHLQVKFPAADAWSRRCGAPERTVAGALPGTPGLLALGQAREFDAKEDRRPRRATAT